MAGIIFASAIPSLVQFLLALRFNIYTGELIKVTLPVCVELITYIPLVDIIIYLIIKFITHQKISDKYRNW